MTYIFFNNTIKSESEISMKRRNNEIIHQKQAILHDGLQTWKMAQLKSFSQFLFSVLLPAIPSKRKKRNMLHRIFMATNTNQLCQWCISTKM